MGSDASLRGRKDVPGPGSYKMKGTEIGNGTYYLSTYK